MPVTSRYLRLTLYTVLILVGAVVAGGWAMQQAKHHALEESARRGPEQLSLYANSLHTLIERYRALPAVLAQDPELIAALAGHVTPEVQAQLNRKLERINGAAQSSTLELLDSTGLAVAASNWNTSNSYVGHNYGFRPYFSQTRSQGTGGFMPWA
jgi:two-component system, NtrC family, C4-dicarboxylate transport sensor histidine kinase DctB